MKAMRPVILALALALAFAAASCQSPSPRNPTTVVRTGGAVTDTPEPAQDEQTRLVRRCERNVDAFEELRLQGKTQQRQAVRRTIARAVDDHFDTFREIALEADTITIRNLATKCLAFAFQKRAEARDTLLVLCTDRNVTIVSNAVLGLGLLLDKETDLTSIIALLGHGVDAVRANAATALTALFLVKQTPRKLTPQYHTAIERLVTLLHDKASTRSRRAAAWALANLRHPAVLDHLVSAIRDEDGLVQIGGLRGLQLLGDQRALEPVLDYLGKAPTSAGASWAQQALEAMVVQAGWAETKAELEDLGTNVRTWRRWIRAQRMK